ncbi:MAG: hypothetical protein EOO90_01300 [Pedobacter sp.]|nr:MAG: hypothetical protein EOO90_01300 [Pedobacter sp.]
MKPSDYIATLGVSLLLIAFCLQNLKIIKTESYSYGLLNLFGASIAGYASWIIAFYPFVILEIFWSLVAIYGIFRHHNSLFHVKQRK